MDRLHAASVQPERYGPAPGVEVTMSDGRVENAGVLSSVKLWINASLCQEVPPDIAVCEFDCRNLECTQGQWEVCPNRRRDRGY